MNRSLQTIVLALCGCMVACSFKSNDLAQVNGAKIKVSDLKARLHEYQFDLGSSTPQESLELKKAVLNEIIEDTLLQQQAKKMNIQVQESEIQNEIQLFREQNKEKPLEQILAQENIPYSYWTQRIKQRILAEKIYDQVTKNVVAPTEKDLQEHYQANFQKYRESEKVYVLQIVVKEKELAQDLRKQILYGADFQELATQHSITPESQKGGQLGWVERGYFPEGLEKIVFSLEKNQLSQVFESSHGFHILKAIEKLPESVIPFEEAKDMIQQEIADQRKQSEFLHWMEQVTAQAEIKRNEVLLEEI
ncbi:MAG: peptidyl-prolyl cis-trans isomerase [Bdellovibrionota bacterium]